MNEKLVDEMSGAVREKLRKMISGKMSESEFDSIIREAIRAELDSLRAKVNQTGKERKK
jgi:ribosomal protein S3AE